MNCWWFYLCVFFLLSLPRILSVKSVVFDSNDSHNDCIPVSPILLPVIMKKTEKSNLLMDVIYVSFFYVFHHSDWVEWVLCLISMLHSMILLLFLQSRCLSIFHLWKRVYFWWMSFVCLLLYLPSRLSAISATFDLSDSANGFVPISPMLFPVDKKCVFLTDIFCVFSFFLSLPYKFSFLSVVFVFSDSLNGITPVSLLILLPVEMM